MTFQPDNYEKKALKTWYAPDHKLHHDMLHPAIKLAGEAGEILDLYSKHKFKPDFDWMDCKHCNRNRNWHRENKNECYRWQIGKEPLNTKYAPLILDELGDWWYYARILAYQSKMSVLEMLEIFQQSHQHRPDGTLIQCLSNVNRCSSALLDDYLTDGFVDRIFLRLATYSFSDVLQLLNLVTIDELTELNYQKLNSEPTNHGWKDAGIEDES